MKTTVQLPSGQIVDLSKCISLKPSTHSDYELILSGYDRPIDLSQSDGIQLKQLLTENVSQPAFAVYSETEQLQRNQIAMQRLQAIIDRDRQQDSSIEAEHFFEDLQQIMDENRPVGKKLFSE
jgi:hypothetical protein